jgi:hypothetical protein
MSSLICAQSENSRQKKATIRFKDFLVVPVIVGKQGIKSYLQILKKKFS